MTTIRPPAAPPAQLSQARAAFFRPAATEAAPVARQPSTALAATVLQPTPTPAPAAKAPQAAPDRPLRPGSIIDIRV